MENITVSVSRNKLLGLLAGLAVLALSIATFFFLSGPSKQDIAMAKGPCERYIKEGMEAHDTYIHGSWIKNGKVVVEVAWQPSRGDSYRTRLCIYDTKTRVMNSPGAFDLGKWLNY